MEGVLSLMVAQFQPTRFNREALMHIEPWLSDETSRPFLEPYSGLSRYSSIGFTSSPFEFIGTPGVFDAAMNHSGVMRTGTSRMNIPILGLFESAFGASFDRKSAQVKDGCFLRPVCGSSRSGRNRHKRGMTKVQRITSAMIAESFMGSRLKDGTVIDRSRIHVFSTTCQECGKAWHAVLCDLPNLLMADSSGPVSATMGMSYSAIMDVVCSTAALRYRLMPFDSGLSMHDEMFEGGKYLFVNAPLESVIRSQRSSETCELAVRVIDRDGDFREPATVNGFDHFPNVDAASDAMATQCSALRRRLKDGSVLNHRAIDETPGMPHRYAAAQAPARAPAREGEISDGIIARAREALRQGRLAESSRGYLGFPSYIDPARDHGDASRIVTNIPPSQPLFTPLPASAKPKDSKPKKDDVDISKRKRSARID